MRGAIIVYILVWIVQLYLWYLKFKRRKTKKDEGVFY